VQVLQEDYAARLSSTSHSAADLDALNFIHTGLKDRSGHPVVLILARNYNTRACSLDTLHTYLIQKLDALVDQPYVIVWAHTEATYWSNCPSIKWLFQTYHQLPDKYRSNLQKVYMLHCDTTLWLGSWAMLPVVSPDLWSKLEWVSRVEFLVDAGIAKQQLLEALPEYVVEHDGILEDEPLVDYGIVKETLQYADMPVR
jgi:Rho GTPase-activating protein 1